MDFWTKWRAVMSQPTHKTWREPLPNSRGPEATLLSREVTAPNYQARASAMGLVPELLEEFGGSAEALSDLINKYQPIAEGMLEKTYPPMPDYTGVVDQYLTAMERGRKRDIGSRIREPGSAVARSTEDLNYAKNLGEGLTKLLAQKAHDEAMRANVLAKINASAGNLAYNLAVKELEGKQGMGRALLSMLLQAYPGGPVRKTPMVGGRTPRQAPQLPTSIWGRRPAQPAPIVLKQPAAKAKSASDDTMNMLNLLTRLVPYLGGSQKREGKEKQPGSQEFSKEEMMKFEARLNAIADFGIDRKITSYRDMIQAELAKMVVQNKQNLTNVLGFLVTEAVNQGQQERVREFFDQIKDNENFSDAQKKTDI